MSLNRCSRHVDAHIIAKHVGDQWRDDGTCLSALMNDEVDELTSP